jgi:hypothetical protein
MQNVELPVWEEESMIANLDGRSAENHELLVNFESVKALGGRQVWGEDSTHGKYSRGGRREQGLARPYLPSNSPRK